MIASSLISGLLFNDTTVAIEWFCKTFGPL